MSRRHHKARNNYPEGYAEHEVEMDWRKERDVELDAKLATHGKDVARLRVLNAVLTAQINKTTARAERAESALSGTISAKLRSISRDIVANIVLAAGTNLIGKVGIDQTTPGTTNAVAPIAGQNGVAAGAGAVSATAQDESDLARWWENFEDPVLTQLVDRAFAGNLDVSAAAARLGNGFEPAPAPCGHLWLCRRWRW